MLPPVIFRTLAMTTLIFLATPVAAKDLTAAELRALRYYVEQGDRRSANAELRRLRALHPDWTPPANLQALRSQPVEATGPGEDEMRVWKLIQVGNWSAARGRLDHLTAAYPDWQPPAEMVRLITVGEAQTRFDAAVKAGDAGTAITVARKTPAILRCDRINNAWQLAAMQQKAGDKTGALTTYRGVLGSCGDGPVVVATLEKAGDISTDAQLRDLATFARQSHPALGASITTVEGRLLAGRNAASSAVRQAAAPAAPVAQPQPAAQPSPEDAAPRPAVPMAKLPPRGDTRVEAVRTAARAGDWQGCLARSTAPRSIEILYERAWCALNRDRSLEALAAFRVVSTAPLGATVQRDARFGMVLAFLANEMTEDAARLAAVTPLTDKQRIEVETVILDQRGVRAFQRDNYEDAINYLNALEQLNGSIRRDLAIMRGYAYLNAGERKIAREHFEKLHNQLATDETRRALNAAIR